jgi:hypothetical protein
MHYNQLGKSDLPVSSSGLPDNDGGDACSA